MQAAFLGLTTWCSENCPDEGQGKYGLLSVRGAGFFCTLWCDTSAFPGPLVPGRAGSGTGHQGRGGRTTVVKDRKQA